MKLSTYIAEVYTISFWQNGGKALCSELAEVCEALWKGDWPNVWYETSQVLLYLLILIHYALAKYFHTELVVELPDWLPWYEDYARIQVWKRLLVIANAPNQKLDPEWFNQGNNWRKPPKVVYVLGQAGLIIDESKAEALINQLESELE